MKVQQPVNQKTVYHCYADLYAKVMNDDVTPEKGAIAMKALDGMTNTYVVEMKRAALENELKGKSDYTKIRTLELKEFAEIPIDEFKSDET